MRLNQKITALVGIAALGVANLAGCSSSSNTGDPDTIDYWLWDANQVPQYQACADDFTKETGIKVKISQTAWNNLTTAMVSGTAPDVFTDHLNYFADFVNKKQIVDLQPYIDRDKLDMGQYYKGLADVWKFKDGHSYGLPKDWDTIAIIYNKKLVDEAGYSADEMNKLTWNPTDGGTYEKAIAHLSVDKNGKRGDEAGFDKDNVAVYGLALEDSGAGFSQEQFAPYFLTTGWTYTDKNPWGTKYNFSDKNYKDTIAWVRKMIEKGYMNTLETATSMGKNALESFGAGKFALVTKGDWMVSSYTALKDVEIGYAPTPIGPSGQRASLFNGLTDAITTSAENPDKAWEWVKYMGSAACQTKVASYGVVFPAVQEASDISQEAWAKEGIDTSAFTVQVEDGTTHLPPITDHYADILAKHQPVMDAILSGQQSVDALDAFNDEVNAMFK
ncbi:MAG: sugar ABC transporter substrate-binding protein [Propionibacteriaceae bacterium]|jgi:multiple sugar transport system substrate-binding protein|nr:sugar ABC transporter substrate-binding protein [Propionibacteriaceae bacterium]